MSHVELTIEDAEFIAYELATELFALDEPFPEFNSRYRNRLESVLMSPFASFGEHEQYPTLEEKAAALFYATCKDHPFQNGNKRMAVVLTMVFLYLNGFFLNVGPMSLYDRALEVTSSPTATHDAVIADLAAFIHDGMITNEEAQRQIDMTATEVDAA